MFTLILFSCFVGSFKHSNTARHYGNLLLLTNIFFSLHLLINPNRHKYNNCCVSINNDIHSTIVKCQSYATNLKNQMYKSPVDASKCYLRYLAFDILACYSMYRNAEIPLYFKCICFHCGQTSIKAISSIRDYGSMSLNILLSHPQN